MDVFQGSDLQLALVETSSLVTLILDSSGTADVVRSQMITGDKRCSCWDGHLTVDIWTPCGRRYQHRTHSCTLLTISNNIKLYLYPRLTRLGTIL
jgi:hypothetical protein